MKSHERAIVIIIRQQQLLVIQRRKKGREYYALPGGSRESGESIEATAIREIQEETGLKVTLKTKLAAFENLGRFEHYFLADLIEGEVCPGAELTESNPDNFYALEWVDLARLQIINLLPEAAKKLCVQCLASAKPPNLQ
ncbi:NUDIX domain-containing protein [candidate division KSB1 bacterium]|nr:NUDIX domain-containing protein [candidate division KSB1 bacterium]